MPPRAEPELILASTSRYRAELLRRLRVPFAARAPEVDETRKPGESPLDLALRLAAEKAAAVARNAPGAWVIGSDQVCMLGDEALGKPGSFGTAFEQLQRLSGQQAVFHTALCVISPDSRTQVRNCPTEVTFRPLSDGDIERYLRLDTPYDCAGSAKSESLGPALLTQMRSDDPTALIGLPLIDLCDMLRQSGFDVLARASAD
ncbi:Maf family protein [Thiomonas bhubaneswarensis]|uniref:7-methyl-GTP pyrophosphatase n=1 Tax=Thiomonas bhubaneswarensis TaxID=339866 RepID=A0A0K6I3F8_9BURK|nr:Maf family nucleotide pyrophosphatase [Thiomonas bhubaneswarensis]CUA97670.1 MAF protein [Thiomonas bhubaneswarensis]